MNGYSRYEILLPLQFNDGRAVPGSLISDTLLEIESRFGAVSHETQTIRGLWRRDGKLYQDKLARIWVDAEDTPENRQFFLEFKERLKVRFQQLDIWISKHPIELL